MVKSKELSEFGEKLSKALKKSGYKYVGKFDDLEGLYTDIGNLSPKAMVDKYAEMNNLKQINAFLDLLHKVYNQKLTSLRVWSAEQGINYKLLISVIRRTDFIDYSGERSNRVYFWPLDRGPMFQDGKYLADLYNANKNYNVPSDLRDMAKKELNNVSDIDTIIEAIQAPAEAEFKLRSFLYNEKTRRTKKKKKEKPAGSTKTVTRKTMDDYLKFKQDIRKEQDAEVPAAPALPSPPVIAPPEKSVDQVELEMLRMEVDYLKKVMEGKDVYIEKLKSLLD